MMKEGDMEETEMKPKAMKPKQKQAVIISASMAAILLTVVVIILVRSDKESIVKVGVTGDVNILDIMCEPSGITMMEDGSLLVTDTYGKQIWQVKDKKSAVYAGGETVADPYGRPLGGYNDAPPEDSFFKYPWAVTPFLDGYAVSDTENDVVRLVCEDTVQTVNADTREDLPMTDMGVAFSHPTGLATDEEGNLYIADTLEGAVRKVTPQGDLTTVASELSEPMGLCWKDGALYVAEAGANRIVKVQDGTVSLVAGSGAEGIQDGNAEEAAFSAPQGVAVGEDETVYITDTGNSAVRMVKNGMVSTLAVRKAEDLEKFSPVSPVGILIVEDELYICDNFARKVFVLSL